ncbi:MAG: hypothetical protein GC162_20650 [Planctomycetes bacterium]|nr:hypothetical protein [Planctomycetota bacterium]
MSDVFDNFPSHYNIKNITEYNNGGSNFGVRLTYEDYFFVDSSNVAHTTVNPNANPQSTNGHFCVNLPDCEHFGFGVVTQPTATRTFWLNKNSDGSYSRINSSPLSIPNPTWNFVPPANPGGQAMLQAAVQAPENEVQFQLPDSLWMKVYETEMDHLIDLADLMSHEGAGIVPQEAAEVETEWELLEGGVIGMNEKPVGANDKAVIRRYEFFQYTGAYDPENHEPLSNWNGVGDPPANELGDFIAANMVAALLAPIPDPSSVIFMLGLGAAMLTRRRR